jgi:branched-chain amino acid transport system substrate-binding protein
MMKAILALSVALAVVASAPPARAQQASEAIKLGVLTDISGPAATNTGLGSVMAAKMAVEDFGGTLLGKPIEVVSGDFLLKVDTGLSVARRWLDQENVDAIVDVPSSPLALALQNVIKEKNKVFLISGGTSADLTGVSCSPNSVHWHVDSYSMGNLVGSEVVKRGGDKWFFITTDTAFGHSLERDTSSAVTRAGGKVLGAVRFPLNSQDFSSALLTAQSSGANVVALASTSSDTANALKQAEEFGMMAPERQVSFVAPLGNIHDFRAAGLARAKGLITVDGFYWDKDEQSRKFAQRFLERMKSMPSSVHGATYSVVLHYLKAVKQAGGKDTAAIMAAMKSIPVEDFFAHNGVVRQDGRMISDRLLLQVKSPAESKGEWDIYKVVREVPGKDVFRPLADGNCPFVKTH